MRTRVFAKRKAYVESFTNQLAENTGVFQLKRLAKFLPLAMMHVVFSA